MGSFLSEVNRFNGRAMERLDLTMRKIHLDLTADIVKLTPVVSGMARSNWFPGDAPVYEVTHEADASGTPSIRRAQQFASTLRAGSTYYICNNLPYIYRLEFEAWSGQAPGGMARVAVGAMQAKIPQIVQAMRL